MEFLGNQTPDFHSYKLPNIKCQYGKNINLFKAYAGLEGLFLSLKLSFSRG